MSKETFNSTRFNKSKNKPFEEVLDANLSRRNVLKGGLGISAMTAFGAFGLSGVTLLVQMLLSVMVQAPQVLY